MKLKYLLKKRTWVGNYNIFWETYWKILHRTVRKEHIVKTGLQPGWYDKDTIILHAMFSILKDFVEVELGGSHYRFSEAYKQIKTWPLLKRITHKIYNLPYFRDIFSPRYPDLGLIAINHYINYTDEQFPTGDHIDQARFYGRELLALYEWWTKTRPSRVSGCELSGFSALCRKHGHMSILLRKDELSESDHEEINEACDRSRKIEEAYDQEDDEMLKRLLDIRRMMWT